MKIVGIIPARYASTRFPGKPLVLIKGKSMIQRVYEQASKCKLLNAVLVATDDRRIYNHVIEFGGKVVMTSAKHRSGTDRIAEAVKKISSKVDVIINIQGDEPYISPKQIRLVADCFKTKEVKIATLAKKFTAKDDIYNPNVVKVIFNKNKEAIYFSRSVIPYNRTAAVIDYYKHVGIYGYRTAILDQITQLKPSLLEKAESLEQLRWLENGFKITIHLTNEETVAIDTPEDLQHLIAGERF